MHWKALRRQMDQALALYEKWGAKGIKVDFMNSDDQEMVKLIAGRWERISSAKSPRVGMKPASWQAKLPNTSSWRAGRGGIGT
jgi:hypothetical protein